MRLVFLTGVEFFLLLAFIYLLQKKKNLTQLYRYIIILWNSSLISIAAGFLFKPPILAGLIIISCDVLAALGTFLFGKYIFSDWVIAQIEKRPVYTALNSVIADEGARFILKITNYCSLV